MSLVLHALCFVLYSQCVKYLVGERSSESSSETDKTIVAKLGSAFHTAKGQGNLAVQETIVLTSGQLGRVAEGELLLVLLLSLLERMMAQSPLITATAHSQVTSLATRLYYDFTLLQATLDMCNPDSCLNRTDWKVPVPSYTYNLYTHNTDFA